MALLSGSWLSEQTQKFSWPFFSSQLQNNSCKCKYHRCVQEKEEGIRKTLRGCQLRLFLFNKENKMFFKIPIVDISPSLVILLPSGSLTTGNRCRGWGVGRLREAGDRGLVIGLDATLLSPDLSTSCLKRSWILASQLTVSARRLCSQTLSLTHWSFPNRGEHHNALPRLLFRN